MPLKIKSTLLSLEKKHTPIKFFQNQRDMVFTKQRKKRNCFLPPSPFHSPVFKTSILFSHLILTRSKIGVIYHYLHLTVTETKGQRDSRSNS